jgi:Thioesterase-like superfamily
MTEADSFYLPLGGDRWLATGHTVGPWDARSQHGGPPSALLARAIQRCAPRDDMIIARFTCEILRAIPVGEMAVRARLVRPGRSVELLEAVATADGSEVLRASAWRVRRAEGVPVEPRLAPPPALPPPAPVPPPAGWVDGYVSALEWRAVRGGFGTPGPATMWARLLYPLVPDEETGPLERVLAVADSGSGAASELPFGEWLFINPELTVHLHREATGEWICMDGKTSISNGGAGLAISVLSDLTGPVGVGTQSLLVSPRPSR